MASEESLKAVFIDKLQATYVQVNDVSGGCGQNFEAIIVSEQFTGKPTLQRHRLVNAAAKDIISKLHAFSQKTFTPTEWAQHQTANQ
ncbi:bola protein [Syncephalis plumigaleata]|nr:bola protein [Syncephalis plumigaleata]